MLGNTKKIIFLHYKIRQMEYLHLTLKYQKTKSINCFKNSITETGKRTLKKQEKKTVSYAIKEFFIT